jgi:chromosome segregation ATPase
MEEATKQEEIQEEVIEEGEIVELEEEVSEKPEELAASDTVEEVQTEEPAETQEQELTDYSDKVQKRINTLTRKLREAERGQDYAAKYAQEMQRQNQVLQQQAQTLQQSTYSESQNRLTAQKAQAIEALKQAHESSDFDKVAKAQEVLSQIAVQENNVTQNLQAIQAQQEQAQNLAQQPLQPQQPGIHPTTEAWISNNRWFLEDEEMYNSAQVIDRELVSEGYIEGSDEYFAEVDKRIRIKHPEKFDDVAVQPKPQQKVASANRSVGKAGKKQVKLSPSEVAMAKKLNVPLKEYAKYVKR